MQIPTFREIIDRLIRGATVTALRTDVATSDVAPRFNVAVRPETRAFLTAQAEALGTSLAAISGNILDSVAAAQLEAVGYSRELLTSRFYLLLKEHGLSLPAAAEVLRSRDITAGDMSDQKLLLEKLDTQTLEWISKHFHVQYDWLVGKSDYPVRGRMGSWYKNQVGAASYLLELVKTGLNVELIIARPQSKIDFTTADSKDENSPHENLLHFVPIIRTTKRAGPREEYDIFEVLESGRWNYWRCRHHIKMVIHFAELIRKSGAGQVYVSGIDLEHRDFSTLLSGSALVPSIVGNTPNSWHPDDFATLSTTVAKDAVEWASIANSDDHKFAFDTANDLLSARPG